jgi:SAM dependent carboxyl methyltransferase
MPDAATPHVSVMEGAGAYGRHSRIPAAGGAIAIPMLEEAAWRVALESSDRPIVIADYGSSDGKNSLAPMRAAIKVLRERIGRERPIIVCHTDLPGNDFSTLISLIESDPESYRRHDPAVFPYAIGRSFYSSVLPPAHVDLGWSSYAAVWLSQIPRQIPDHFFIPCCTGPIRDEFDRQAALDWEAFLASRATELRPGGRLVVALPSLAHDGSMDIAPLMDHANAVLAELVDAGVVSAEERSRMTIASCPRRERDLLAPFAESGQFRGLTVEHVSTYDIPDNMWTDYARNGDAMALASKRALFFRVIFVPSIVQALAATRSGEERRAFSDQLEEGVRRRLARAPARLNSRDHRLGEAAGYEW